MLRKLLQNFGTPFGLLLLCILGYGLLMPWLGFYYDDWPFAWITHRLGPAEFFPAFSMFRPFLAPIFFITTSVFAENPFAWQVFGLAVRLVASLAVWWSLCQIWPKHTRQAGWVAMFFAIFPGFSQQWISLTHTNQELIPLVFYLLSLGWMARAARSGHAWQPVVAALAFTVLGVFPTEYFLSLELLRPVILWIVLSDEHLTPRKRLSQTLLRWLPYLAILIANMAWLVFYHRSPAYSSYPVTSLHTLSNNPTAFIIQGIEDIIQTIATAGFSSWTQTLLLFTQPLNAAASWLALGVTGLSFGVLLIYLLKIELPQNSDPITNPGEADQWAKSAVLLGLFGILLGRLPSWSVGLPLKLEFPYDRFMQSMLLGASLFFVGLLEFLVKAKKRKIALFSLFLSLAVGYHFTTANTYRRDWENQRLFFWQLTWRMPGLKPGTLLLTHELPFQYVTDNSLSAPLNWTFDPQNTSRGMRYMLVYTKARLGTDLLPRLAANIPIHYPYRTFTFDGSTSQAVVIFYPVPGCLRVMDPVYSNQAVFPDLTYMLTDAISLSDPGLITPEADQPATPPAALFGPEPPHDWCYYFEKAELARQSSYWEEVARIGRAARDLGLQARLPLENLVFIEGSLRTGDWDTARQLTLQTWQAGEKAQAGLCATWKRFSEDQDIAPELRANFPGMLRQINCNP